MRILVVVHDFQPGGAERIAIRLASRWANGGESVAVACGSPEGELRSLLDERVLLLPPPTPIARSRFSRRSVAAFAAQASSAFDPDVIFLPGNFYAGMAVTLRLKLRARSPLLVTKFSNSLRRLGRGRFGQAAFAAALAFKTAFSDHLVVIDPSLRAEALHSLPWPAARYSVMAQPVLDDSDAALPARRAVVAGEPPLLIAAGRLIGQKNFAGLIDAAARIERPFRLHIYGKGPQRAELEARIAMHGLGGRVFLPGYIDELSRPLAGARLFVLSSNYEGFPSVLVEALAAGVPVVATRCSPAIGAIVASEEAGLMVDVGDTAGLARAIEASLDRDEPDPDRLASEVERFRITPTANSYLDLFRRLLAGSNRRLAR